MVSHILKDLELAGIISDDHYGGYSTQDLAISIQQTVKALFTEIRYRTIIDTKPYPNKSLFRIDYGLLITQDLQGDFEAAATQGASMIKSFLKVSNLHLLINKS